MAFNKGAQYAKKCSPLSYKKGIFMIMSWFITIDNSFFNILGSVFMK